MQKSILVFSNGEKIGDGIIKLPLVFEIKKRLPDFKLVWMTNKGTTAYNHQLKSLTKNYIDEVIEKADINIFFWKKISKNYNLESRKFDFIFDTQKAVFRTYALKRIKCNNFISTSANGIFSTIKYNLKNDKLKKKYYLDELFDLLNLIKKGEVNKKFNIKINNELKNKINKIFFENKKYIGIAPGAGEKNKIWPIEKFIEVAKYFESKNFVIVLFLGPQEMNLKKDLKKIFPKAIFPEELLSTFPNVEVVIASTKFISCALTNDSGISHILSLGNCPLVKLFGPKDHNKFTPLSNKIITIDSHSLGSKNVSIIPTDLVINTINNKISND